LLLCKFFKLLGRVATDAETVRHTREEIDLVWLSRALENLLRLVTLLGWEDRIGFGGGNGQRARNSLEFFVLDGGGMGDVADLDAALVVPS
jgi:hypothetical protein